VPGKLSRLLLSPRMTPSVREAPSKRSPGASICLLPTQRIVPASVLRDKVTRMSGPSQPVVSVLNCSLPWPSSTTMDDPRRLSLKDFRHSTYPEGAADLSAMLTVHVASDTGRVSPGTIALRTAAWSQPVDASLNLMSLCISRGPGSALNTAAAAGPRSVRPANSIQRIRWI
jgi:hypothetical protein